MRAVTVTKEEFDDFLYPAFATQGSENEEQLEIAARLKRKLRKYATAEAISEVQQREAMRRGTKMVPFLKLNDESADIMLEEDEYRLLLDRVRRYIPSITSAVAEEFYEFYENIKNAPSGEVN